jgi:hypothetical protein
VVELMRNDGRYLLLLRGNELENRHQLLTYSPKGHPKSATIFKQTFHFPDIKCLHLKDERASHCCFNTWQVVINERKGVAWTMKGDLRKVRYTPLSRQAAASQSKFFCLEKQNKNEIQI